MRGKFERSIFRYRSRSKLRKGKKLIFKYKKIIIITLSIFIIAIVIILYTNNTKNNRDLRLSGYLVEIVSIINDDEDKAIRELEKLTG